MEIDYYEKLIEEAKSNPCCSNCKHCYWEYGQYDCYYSGNGVPADKEVWDMDKDVCDKWTLGM